MLVEFHEPYARHAVPWWIKCIEEATAPEGEIVAINGIVSAAACGTEVAKVFVIEIRTNVLINLRFSEQILQGFVGW